MKIDYASKIGSIKEKNKSYVLEIKSNQGIFFSIPILTSKVPSNGLFLGEKIVESGINVGAGLEIGAGQYAPASFCLLANDIKTTVDLIEIDNDDCRKLNKLINENNIVSRAKCFCGSLFEVVPKQKKYDLIFSNIAQMPLENNKPAKTHDHGGSDGWEYLDEIIRQAPNYLHPSGYLALMIFDFLGIEARNNEKILSAKERLNTSNFEIVEIVPYLKLIRPGGETEKALDYIFSIYPRAVLYEKDASVISKEEYFINKRKNIYVAFQFVLARLKS